jgi:hypothetical protein
MENEGRQLGAHQSLKDRLKNVIKSKKEKPGGRSSRARNSSLEGPTVNSNEGVFIVKDNDKATEQRSFKPEKHLLGAIEDDKKRGAAFEFYFNAIHSGNISSVAELESRFANRIGEFNVLLDDEGENIKNEYGYGKSIPEQFQFPIDNPQQQEVFRELYDVISDDGVSKETKALLKRYLKSEDATDLNKLDLFITDSRELAAERVRDVLVQYNSVRRQVELRKELYDSVFDQDTAENLLARSYLPQDRTLVQEFSGVFVRAELARNREEVIKRVTLDGNVQEVYRFIDSLPIRPSVEEFDYLQAQIDLKETVGNIYAGIEDNNRLKRANEIRHDFGTKTIGSVMSEIGGLPSETREERAIRSELFDMYKKYVVANNPDAFNEQFADSIEENLASDVKENFINPDLGKNKEAYRYLRENFLRAVLPLIESFKDDPRTKEDMQKFLAVDRKNGQFVNPKLKFLQRLNALEKQRPLTDTERRYIDSVQLLSLFNPYLVSAVNADQGVTSEYLRHHFNEVSKKTTEQIKDGEYFPLIQIGTGPNGLAALGEIVRNNPELARQALIVDSGDQPGGPFAIPRGPAWELNSANRRGSEGAVLPQKPGGNELKTVRAYGSPVARWYPGERSEGSDIRQGSINTTVDYLPAPDDLSTKRYPTNEELQLILSLQAAMLTDNLALRTSVVKVEPNPNANEKGNKIATLKMLDKEGKEKLVQVRTDALLVSTGLGEPSYGFDLKGSRAEKVLEETKNADGFPKISTTLEAFRAFSDRTKEKDSPGKTLVIWGKGNSADTLIEFVGNIFQGENPQVRDVTKIYIISDGDLSKRPRYSLISDLKPRNGNGNLIEQVNARVADVDFADGHGTQREGFFSRFRKKTNGQPSDKQGEGDVSDRQLTFYDNQGRIITDSDGKPIVGDSGIAATGFRSQLDQVFESYLEGSSLRQEGQDGPLQPLTLPTNPDVSVADSLKADPSIVFLGTASKPRFDLEKLAQLPVEAREALLRNGAENAVAIGFRAPDTQAAVNIWLNSRRVRLTPEEQKPLPKIPIDGDNAPKTRIEVERSEMVDQVQIPDNVVEEDLFLSPLLAYELGNKFELSRNFSGDVDFDLIYDKNEKKFSLKFKGGDVESVSSEFLNQLSEAASDEYFQAYALSLLEKRRRDPKLNVSVGFRRGKINPKGTFVQTA